MNEGAIHRKQSPGEPPKKWRPFDVLNPLGLRSLKSPHNREAMRYIPTRRYWFQTAAIFGLLFAYVAFIVFAQQSFTQEGGPKSRSVWGMLWFGVGISAWFYVTSLMANRLRFRLLQDLSVQHPELLSRLLTSLGMMEIPRHWRPVELQFRPHVKDFTAFDNARILQRVPDDVYWRMVALQQGGFMACLLGMSSLFFSLWVLSNQVASEKGFAIAFGLMIILLVGIYAIVGRVLPRFIGRRLEPYVDGVEGAVKM